MSRRQVIPANFPGMAPFRRLARTHALMALGDSSMYGALAGSVLFSLSPDAQRSKVLLYLLVTVAPFAVVAPLIGPAIDRMPGGRRMIVVLTAVVRAITYVLLAFHTDDLLLYPLVFVALVMQKTYAVSRSAIVPEVVRDHDELVQANSKLSLIAGLMGAATIGPLTLFGRVAAGIPLAIGVIALVLAALAARRLPFHEVSDSPPRSEQAEGLRSAGIVLASGAITVIRGTIGFLTFHLLFWLREDYGFWQVGLAVAASTTGSMSGNLAAPFVRRWVREERMLAGGLGVVALAGLGAASTGGVATAVILAFVVGASSAIGRMAFDAIVQRDAPDADQGRAFARFETRFQLAWVFGGLPPVAVTMPGRLGFFVVGTAGAFAAATYLIGARTLRRGRPLPPSLGERVRTLVAGELRRRRSGRRAPAVRRPVRDGRPTGREPRARQESAASRDVRRGR
ncbi:MAG: MFS transporter [Ilumatobacteraceae bacterium]